jgi:hypothetical protein
MACVAQQAAASMQCVCSSLQQRTHPDMTCPNAVRIVCAWNLLSTACLPFMRVEIVQLCNYGSLHAKDL